MEKAGLVGPSLVGVGTVLLIAGASLAHPYVHSRLARPVSVMEREAFTKESTTTVDTGNPSSVAKAPQAGTSVSTEATEPSPTLSTVVVSAFIRTVTPESSESEAQEVDATRPTRIVIPTPGIDAPVVKVSRQSIEIDGQAQIAWEAPDAYAAGWHETSAPLGVPGNTVLNGHNTTNGEIFRDLYTLKIGDNIILYSEDISRTYDVVETLILPEAGQPLEVRLENARYVMPTDDERLTLVTCHPYGSLRNRLIVIARPNRSDVLSEPLEE